MLARFHRSVREKDEGFTLIELLVVMIIIGILAAIAVPVFLTQRQKARDASVKADVTNIGKEVATYYVDGTGIIYGVVGASKVSICTTSNCAAASDLIADVKLSNGNSYGPASATTVITYPASCSGKESTNWIVGLTNSNGSSTGKTWYYSAQSGLSTTAPACV